ncbi:lactonase family protein [Mucilaginibacter sp. dw_454]|uniref:lactonase family protein n=1 Tax=Mucilaginibacter sp. dw_454 TaxID=2720079 RepID=UPI001BD3274B|nr:lactonase family protein [Mucilaginibacter sp. dw_454]
MKKLLLVIALAAPLISSAQKSKTGPKVFDLLIGTYTGNDANASKGIYVYRFYAERGETAYLNEVETDNPSFLTPTEDGQFVYAVNENNADGTGGVSAFKFDKKTGVLTPINKQKTKGSPAHISVDKAQKNVFVSNYGGGNLQVFPLNKDGSLGEANQTIQDVGKGPDLARQNEPHVHSAFLSPDEKYLVVSDLGLDKINFYRYKASKVPALTPADVPFIATAPGSGPRHTTFSADGKFMYNVQEMKATVTAYTYDNGKAKEIQTIDMMPGNFSGTNGAADIHISPDGRYLYATNRGTANLLVIFAVDQVTGKLSPVGSYSTEGENPRNFMIDPTGNYLLIGTTNRINIFRIEKATGKLRELRAPIKVSKAVCLKMVAVE